nr:hypothetical protein [Tanacetum cinerariifolium]
GAGVGDLGLGNVVGRSGESCEWREEGIWRWREILCVAQYFECKDREAVLISRWNSLCAMTTRNQEINNALKSHDKAITEIQATLSALSKQQEAILKALSGEGGGSGSAFNTNGAYSRNNRSLQIGKIDFPKFSGDDVKGWVYHCEHFFAMDETPEGMKLRSILARFSNAMFEDPLEVNLNESQAISLYLKALSLDIRGMVKMFRSRTLHEAYGLAKTQALNNESLEEKINKGKGNSGNTRNYSNFNITPPVNASKLPLLPTPKPAKTTFTIPNGGPRHLTSKELEYKRSKGECFWCTKKFVPGHKCPRNQVYVIKMEDDEDEETEEIGAETKEKEHQILIHALTGLPSYSTMRVQGFVGNRQTSKGLPPTRPFDLGEMDQSEQDATWEFLDELQLRFLDFSELVSCGQEIF